MFFYTSKSCLAGGGGRVLRFWHVCRKVPWVVVPKQSKIGKVPLGTFFTFYPLRAQIWFFLSDFSIFSSPFQIGYWHLVTFLGNYWQFSRVFGIFRQLSKIFDIFGVFQHFSTIIDILNIFRQQDVRFRPSKNAKSTGKYGYLPPNLTKYPRVLSSTFKN